MANDCLRQRLASNGLEAILQATVEKMLNTRDPVINVRSIVSRRHGQELLLTEMYHCSTIVVVVVIAVAMEAHEHERGSGNYQDSIQC